PLLLLADDSGLTGIYMEPHRHGPDGVDPAWIRDDERFAEARVQLGAYFVGELQRFELPLNPTGTAFQQGVWAALRTIPYGETRSYGEIAEQIGRPGTARAVGLANGRNPLSVVVPCHRVVGASGSLTGYGGGIERKRLLLDLEARVAGHQLQP
ncbi:MAG: methylated-DNA--[protein]-cysteine S-methyltransferase, partial [Jiangellaceae bacterium]